MGSVQKLCCACSTDVAGKKRVKDQRGQYYCQPCYESKVEQKRGATATVAASGTTTAKDPYDFPPNNDGEIGLAEEKSFAPPVQEEMFGCSDCKKVVAKRQIRNDDGEFICIPCFSKRRQKQLHATGAGAKVRKSFAEEDGGTDGALPFTYTLHGGLIISACLIVLAFAIFFTLAVAWPETPHRGMHAAPIGLVFDFLGAGLETIFVIFRGGALICSMFVAARILGGCDFGYLGSALWKALAAALFLTVVGDFMDRNETLMMLGFAFRGIIFVLTFIVIFKLDYFEAMLLSFINFFVFWGLAIGMAMALAWAVAMMSHRNNAAEFDDLEAPAIVHPQPAAAPEAAAPNAPQQPN